MAYVASIYNPQSEHDDRPRDSHQVRYLAGFYELNELGLQLRRQAGQVSWDEAEQQIALSDGGSGIEPFLRTNFPLAEIIIDFWHAKEHLLELAKAVFSDEVRRQDWMNKTCHKLKHEGGFSNQGNASMSLEYPLPTFFLEATNRSTWAKV